jgi:membrane associated rhomboid family serine protease
MAILISSDYSANMESYEQQTELWQPLPIVAAQGKAGVRTMALVLDSRSIPCCIDHSAAGWQLLVPPSHLESALREVRLYEEANRNWPPSLPVARAFVGSLLPTISVLILLATFHNLTLIGIAVPGYGQVDLRDVGAAHAEQIMRGEWWQAVTALTLHSDWLHLLSNLTIGGVFIVLLCRELGSGLAWSLLLGSGILGNLFNAVVRSTPHHSLGASTAVFGTVGILAALSTVRYRSFFGQRWFLPLAAGVALLAVLGTEGEHTDVAAHLFGFCAGLLLGVVTEYVVSRVGRPGAVLNSVLGLMSAALVATSWWLAITGG